MSDVFQLQGEFFWVGLAVLVAASILLWGSTRYVFDPVRALTRAAARISQGDFEVQIPEMRKNEVGNLAGSFEQMRRKISFLLDEERRRGEGLQVQVRKATKDLASMYEVSQTVNRASLNLNELLGAVLDKVVAAIEPADAGVLFLVDGGAGLAPAACSGYDLDDLTKIVIRPGEGAGGKAPQQGPLALKADEPGQEIRRNLSKRDAFLLDQATASLPPVKSALALLLAHGGVTQGVLVVVSHRQEDAFSREHASLARSVADQVAVGLANARLYQELQRREASRTDLVRKLITAQEEERRRVARELHDEAGQALTAVMMSAARAEQALRPDMKEAKTRLVEARSQASQALDDVRRLIFDLRPQVLDDLGLVPALRWFVKDRLQAAGVESRLETTGIKGRLPSLVEVTVFRVIQEALTNIIRHSGASKAAVRLSLKGSVLEGVIEDNGKGLEVEKVLMAQAPQEGWGLRGMEERVHLLGGTLAVRSRLGKGARIRFRIPLEGAQEGVQRDEQYTSITG